MGNALDDLTTALDESDFGIFVFAADDIVHLRDNQFSSVRDNVVFEFGLLAAYLAPHVNMIASTDWVQTKDLVKWEKSFYQCLSRGSSLSTASEIAKATSKAPMILLMKKDMAFA